MDPLDDAVESIIAHFKKWDSINPEPEKIPIFILTIGVGERRSAVYDQESTNYDALNSALKHLSANTEDGTKTDTFLTAVEQQDTGYKSICKMPYVFMLSLDDATKPNLMNVNCTSLDLDDAGNLFDKYDDETNLYKKMGRHGEIISFGVSAQIPMLTSQVSETDMWTKIRKEGDFKSMRGIYDNNPLTKLYNILTKIILRKGIILVHNDAWWDTMRHPTEINGVDLMYHASPYIKNAFMESYPWLGTMLWDLPDLKNVWFLSRISGRDEYRSGLMKWKDGLKNITELPYKDFDGTYKPAKKGLNIRPGFSQHGVGIKMSSFNELIHVPPVPPPPVILPVRRGGKRNTRRQSTRKRGRSHRRRRG